jgi:hypothetical protein
VTSSDFFLIALMASAPSSSPTTGGLTHDEIQQLCQWPRPSVINDSTIDTHTTRSRSSSGSNGINWTWLHRNVPLHIIPCLLVGASHRSVRPLIEYYIDTGTSVRCWPIGTSMTTEWRTESRNRVHWRQLPIGELPKRPTVAQRLSWAIGVNVDEFIATAIACSSPLVPLLYSIVRQCLALDGGILAILYTPVRRRRIDKTNTIKNDGDIKRTIGENVAHENEEENEQVGGNEQTEEDDDTKEETRLRDLLLWSPRPRDGTSAFYDPSSSSSSSSSSMLGTFIRNEVAIARDMFASGSLIRIIWYTGRVWSCAFYRILDGAVFSVNTSKPAVAALSDSELTNLSSNDDDNSWRYDYVSPNSKRLALATMNVNIAVCNMDDLLNQPFILRSNHPSITNNDDTKRLTLSPSSTIPTVQMLSGRRVGMHEPAHYLHPDLFEGVRKKRDARGYTLDPVGNDWQYYLLSIDTPMPAVLLINHNGTALRQWNYSCHESNVVNVLLFEPSYDRDRWIIVVEDEKKERIIQVISLPLSLSLSLSLLFCCCS